MPKAPPSAEEARFCPLIGRNCIQHACMFWIGIWGQKQAEGEPILDEECAIVWNVLLERETLIETARVTAGHDKAATQVNLLGQLIERRTYPPSILDSNDHIPMEGTP
jgi:hypothetical protein